MAGIFGGAGYEIKKALLTRKVPLKGNDTVLLNRYTQVILKESQIGSKW